MRAVLIIVAALAALAAASPARADYFVVVGEHSPVAQLSHEEVLHLFMGRARSFPDGSPAAPYELTGTAQREGFYRALSGMTLPQVTSYWARLMFSGRNLPPTRLADEISMIDRLRKDHAAIGWLTTPPAAKGLRTVLVLKATP